MTSTFYGVGTALITPFKSDLSIDFTALENIINYVSNGSDYLVVNGTTGESPTTTKSEQQQLLEFTKKHNPKKLPIVFGIGGNNTYNVLETIKQTDFEGVSAILSVCPYYNKPSQAGLIAHYTTIAEASPIPVILYNVPGRTVTSLTIDTIVELARHPNIIGLKDASSSLEQAQVLANTLPSEFLLVSGDDNLVTAQISIGYKGVISVIANGFSEPFHEMTHAALKGDFKAASSIQFKFIEFDKLLYAESNPVGIKKVCAIRGLCEALVRLPLVEATPDLGKALESAMKKEGFL
ncbi:MAG: 4-hydroxy-tetrahydrodipicolinate synthase [Spirosomataceae bacterium]|jgi:4-hydroxy-tetrahydrodipicolinate synthase